MPNINPEMTGLGKVRSVIRETFEYGNKRAAEIGRENVFDFSLGNPSVPAPQLLEDTIAQLASQGNPIQVHGYTSAQGAVATRQAIADDLNKRFNAGIDKDDLYMTCGAAASLTISIHALTCPGDEFITFAPFFPEYTVFVESAGAKLVVVPADTKNFQIDFEKFVSLISPKTKAVIINTPNNPTGVVFSEETIIRLCDILREKSEEFGSPIYLISDEPYRELVYDGQKVPYLTNYYDYTLVCYSFSKSLSLPGDRIGYILVSSKIPYNRDVYAAVCGAGRALGYVCAPSMMQQAVIPLLGKTSDISVYKKNRDLLYNALTEYGFECVYPDGAFYLFVKSPEDDANAFCQRARDFELLLVPSDSFGCKGYVRIAYCTATEMIKKSLPAFKNLAESYGK